MFCVGTGGYLEWSGSREVPASGDLVAVSATQASSPSDRTSGHHGKVEVVLNA